MAKRRGAGSLSERIIFQQRLAVDDGYGGTHEDWQDIFTDNARLMPRMGSETVIASRLQGIQPYTLTVRSHTQTRQVTPAWQAKNARTGETYDIATVVNIDERNAWIEMLVTAKGG